MIIPNIWQIKHVPNSHHNLSLDHEAMTNFRTQQLGHTVEIVEGDLKGLRWQGSAQPPTKHYPKVSRWLSAYLTGG